MRRLKKSILDFTPLLDVVLLMLFVFLMMASVQANQQEEALDNQSRDYEQLEREVEQLEREVEVLEKDQENLLSEISEKDKELATFEVETDKLEKENAKEVEALNETIKALSEFMSVSENDINDLMNQSDHHKEVADIIDEKTLAETVLKYDALKSQFYFIDVELKTKNNRLHINNQSTSIGIDKKVLEDTDYLEDKIKVIKESLEKTIEKRQGGSSMIFITLKVQDQEVYQYAWNVVWEAIGDLQIKYGTDKVFRNHITLLNEN